MCKKKKILMFVLCTFVFTFAFGVTCFASSNDVAYNKNPSNFKHYATFTLHGKKHIFTTNGNLAEIRVSKSGNGKVHIYFVDSNFSSPGECFLDGESMMRYSFTFDETYDPNTINDWLKFDNSTVDVTYYDYLSNESSPPLKVFFSKTLSLGTITEQGVQEMGQTVANQMMTIVKVALLILSSMVSVVLLVRFGRRWSH